MTTKVVPGMLVAVPDAETHAREAASRIGKVLRDAIAARGQATIALSGSNTPLPTYARLGGDAQIDWSKVHVFWVDERAVPRDDARSNYRGARESLLTRAAIPQGNVHRMHGEDTDLERAARDYEQELLVHVPPAFGGAPSFDAMVMGIGDDGHTASIFPRSSTVHARDRLVVAVPAAPPEREARLTLTPPVIESARALFILALGAKKAVPLERVWEIEGDAALIPARLLRGCHGSITWLIDRAAGGLIG